MRRPKSKDKQADDDRQPAGGRAWRRVQDFARARGLPASDTPAQKVPTADSPKTKPGPKTKG